MSAITIWSVWQTIWVTAAWKRQDVIRSSAAVKRAAEQLELGLLIDREN